MVSSTISYLYLLNWGDFGWVWIFCTLDVSQLGLFNFVADTEIDIIHINKKNVLGYFQLICHGCLILNEQLICGFITFFKWPWRLSFCFFLHLKESSLNETILIKKIKSPNSQGGLINQYLIVVCYSTQLQNN